MEFRTESFIKSSTELTKKFEKLLDEIESKMAAVIQSNVHDYTLYSLRAIALYTNKTFERVKVDELSPIEYQALSARNLFECLLLTQYIISDPSIGKKYIEQKFYDDIEINKGFLILEKERSINSIIGIKARIQELMTLAEHHDLKPSKHWTVSFLAQQTNNKEEFDAFFKLYSKYIHPSSWLLNSHVGEYDNEVFRNIFYSQGHIFVERILKEINKYLYPKKP